MMVTIGSNLQLVIPLFFPPLFATVFSSIPYPSSFPLPSLLVDLYSHYLCRSKTMMTTLYLVQFLHTHKWKNIGNLITLST